MQYSLQIAEDSGLFLQKKTNTYLQQQLLEQPPKPQLVFDADPSEIPTAWLSEIEVVLQFHEISIDHLRLDLCFQLQEPFRERKQ